ncbi:MAG TPA: chloride channel protein [Acidimicrobiales bacterium]|nr:chloride channel protein [Acidimicrobiales bacterium]
MTTPVDPFSLLRTRRYVVLLILAAILGVPISAAAYYFLWLVDRLQPWTYTSLPDTLGFHGEPVWWPVLPLFVAGLLVALTIRYVPGHGGHSPVEGFKAGGAPSPVELPGILIAALASIGLGAVIGPEAPLIALGGGLAALVVWLAKRDSPAQTVAVVGAAGSFAAISALLGSPLIGAFLLMEAAGLGGPMLTVVLLPGLLAAGIGFLIFIGLDSLTGLGTFSLAIPQLPHFAHPNGAEFAWAIVIGVAAAIVGNGIGWLGRLLRAHVEPRMLLLTPVVGAAIAGLAIAYAEGTGKSTSDVLFSGQAALPNLIHNAADYPVGALALLVVCKGLAYGASLSSFRGGPIFPAMFIGTAGGLALSHAPGLPLVPAVAMGIGAMCAARLRLPLTSVLLASLLLASDSLAVMPLVIVAVVVSFVVSTWFTPTPNPAPAPAPSDAATPGVDGKAPSAEPSAAAT